MLDADPVGRYRVEDASPTDGVVEGTAGKVAGTTTGVVAGVPAGVVAVLVDAHPVGRDRVEDVRPTDLAGEAGGELTRERRGAADRGKPCEAAGAVAQKPIKRCP
jgi:hypothetical protein